MIGLFPGYALASYDPTLQKHVEGPTYSKDEILQAASTSLLHRGNGTGPDGDAGWEKAWRAAAWAQLGDTESFYHELTVSQLNPYRGLKTDVLFTIVYVVPELRAELV